MFLMKILTEIVTTILTTVPVRMPSIVEYFTNRLTVFPNYMITK